MWGDIIFEIDGKEAARADVDLIDEYQKETGKAFFDVILENSHIRIYTERKNGHVLD